MADIAAIVGAVSGCISLIGIVYLFGMWRGKVDTALNSFNQCLKDYPPAEMWTMTKTLWDVYVMDALRHRPDLAGMLMRRVPCQVCRAQGAGAPEGEPKRVGGAAEPCGARAFQGTHGCVFYRERRGQPGTPPDGTPRTFRCV